MLTFYVVLKDSEEYEKYFRIASWPQKMHLTLSNKFCVSSNSDRLLIELVANSFVIKAIQWCRIKNTVKIYIVC